MNRVIDHIFRRADLITVERGGETIPSRGVISPAGQEEISCLPLPHGTVEEPLFLYMGDCDGLQRGDLLRFEKTRYRVLAARLVKGFGRIFYMRAVLEKAGEEPEE